VHGYDEYDRPQFLGLALKIRRATFVAAVSHYGRSQLLRWCDLEDRGKIGLVRCGLDAPASPEGLQGQPAVSHRFICIARMCREKAQETLLLAMESLVAKGRKVELVLVGDGETRPWLEAMIDRMGLADHVRMTGWLSGENVRAEICAARALVVPSFAENLPVVIMEAMALGKPVIATAIAGIPELVVTGETGWIVPASSVELLAEAMESCLDSSTEALAQLGRRGHERVRRDHSAFEEAGKLSRLFKS
jgi:colanic acid/amylovoran biosynthesis glycosyltransferase